MVSRCNRLFHLFICTIFFCFSDCNKRNPP